MSASPTARRAALLLPLALLLGSGLPPVALAAAPPGPARAAQNSPSAIVLDDDQPTQGSLLRGRVIPAAAQLSLDGAAIRVADDGAFIIAFDRDAAPMAQLTLALPGGSVITRSIAVAPGGWRIENVDASLTGGAASSAEFAARRAGELAQIAAARAISVHSDGWRQAFVWPVRARLSGQFGAQRIYRGTPASYHAGTDLAAANGTPFVAPADGVVTLAAAAPFTLEGNLLIVDHGMGLTSAFLHCSRLDVHVGDVVRQGQVLGLTGATGRASGPHLHWGIKWGAARLDPARLANR